MRATNTPRATQAMEAAASSRHKQLANGAKVPKSFTDEQSREMASLLSEEELRMLEQTIG